VAEPAKRYRAFISYSQRDKRTARRIHTALERYRVPKGVDAGAVPGRRLGRFFRDDEEMGASGSLGAALTGAIDDSENLIVICSPAAAQSRWVDAEVRRFKTRGAPSVFAVIIDGEPHALDPSRECFPPSLKVTFDATGVATGEPDEPRAPDLRREGLARVRAQLAAGLLGIPFDTLWRRDRRRHRRMVLAMAAASLVVTVTLAAFGAAAVQQARETLSRTLAHEATQAGVATDLALLLAAEAHEIAASPEAHASLLRAVRSNPRLVTYVHRAERIQDVSIDGAAMVLAVASCSGSCPASELSVYRLDQLEASAPPVSFPGEIRALRMQDDGGLIVSYVDGEQHVVERLDIRNPGGPRALVYRTNEPVAVGASSDGALVAVSTRFETKIFDRRVPAMWCHLDPGGALPVAMAFSSDNRYFALAGPPRTGWTRLADRTQTSCEMNELRMPASVSDVSFDEAANNVYVVAHDGTVMRQPLGPDPQPEVFSPFPAGGEGLQNWFGPGARQLLVHFRNRLRVYPLAAREELVEARRREEAEGGDFVSISFINRAIDTLHIPDLLNLDAKRAVMSRDGRVVVAHDNRSVSVWDLTTDALVTETTGFVDAVEERPEALSPDGRFRVVVEPQTNGQCGGDSNDLCETWTMVRLFEVRSGGQIDALRGATRSLPEAGPLMVAFDRESRIVVTRESGTEVWTVAPEAVRERACRMANRDLTEEELRRYFPSWWQRAFRRHPACGR
jgi:hypothetical protein